MTQLLDHLVDCGIDSSHLVPVALVGKKNILSRLRRHCIGGISKLTAQRTLDIGEKRLDGVHVIADVEPTNP